MSSIRPLFRWRDCRSDAAARPVLTSGLYPIWLTTPSTGQIRPSSSTTSEYHAAGKTGAATAPQDRGWVTMERCPNCGAPARPGAKFCTTCGYRFDDNDRAINMTDTPPSDSAPSGPTGANDSATGNWPSPTDSGASASAPGRGPPP